MHWHHEYTEDYSVFAHCWKQLWWCEYTKYTTKIVSLWTFKAKFLHIISLNNRFLNIYEQCIIKMSFLSCNYEIKCIFNIFNFIFHMSTCWFCKWYEKCGLCWCTASLRWGELVMIIIIKKAMLTCIWKQKANSCPDITSDVLLTLPSTESLSLHFLLYAFSLNTIKRRLQGNLLEQPMPFIPHTPEDFLPDKLWKKFLVVTIWQTLMQLIRESVGLG